MRCSACGFDNPPAMRFCGGCGAKLSGGAGSAMADADAERRQLTVLFCDVVESTALSVGLDPELLRTVIRRYQDACGTVIQQLDGHVAQYLGDGILVYFGFPRAHEDDPRRAVLAGLRILAAVESLNHHLDLSGVELHVRIGIHTGLVVVGEIGGAGRTERLALGQTPNVAARLQGLAPPDAVIVSEATHQLVGGFFDCEAMGEHTPRGLTEPIGVHRVWGESQTRSQFDLSLQRGVTPVVGRQTEIDRLAAQLELARAGTTQVALISGEAGIGKSRLIHALEERTAAPSVRWLRARCSPYHVHSPFEPLIDLLHRLFEEVEPSSTSHDGAQTVLDRYGLGTPETVGLIRSLLRSQAADHGPETPMGPVQRATLIEALETLIIRLAEERLVALVVEDLHWGDPSTLELLDRLVRREGEARLCFLFTFRPGFENPWPQGPHVSRLDLDRLSMKDAEAIVLYQTGGRPLVAEVLQEILSKTDGVPLFVEELTKAMLESGALVARNGSLGIAGPLVSVSIPATLRDSLMARLDRLGSAKRVAQVASVLGRRFSPQLLQAVLPEQSSLGRELDRLLESQLLSREGSDADPIYTFRHALIQDAAYGSLLNSARRQYHALTATTLVERFPERAAAFPEVVARHYTEATRLPEAVDYWHRAGIRALQRSANAEAISSLHSGLELVPDLPEGLDRNRAELGLLATLGTALSGRLGFAAPEVETAYRRARNLCDAVGDAPELFWVVWGLWGFFTVRGKLPEAAGVARELIQLAGVSGDPTLMVEARFAAGSTEFLRGNWIVAARELDLAAALAGPLGEGKPAAGTGQNAVLLTQMYRAMVLCHEGLADQARIRCEQGLEIARRAEPPFSLVAVLSAATIVHQFLREPDQVAKLVREIIAISREKGFFWDGTIVLGWALAHGAPTQDEAERAIDVGAMRQSLDRQRAAGTRASETYNLGMIAETVLQSSDLISCEALLEEALAVAEETGERFWEPELLRLRGELSARPALSPSDRTRAEDAERWFERALTQARGQGSVLLGLRTAVSYGTLLARTDRRQDAVRVVRDAYDKLVEGLDARDAIRARLQLETWRS